MLEEKLEGLAVNSRAVEVCKEEAVYVLVMCQGKMSFGKRCCSQIQILVPFQKSAGEILQSGSCKKAAWIMTVRSGCEH